MGQKWWGSDLSTTDLRKILDRRVKEIERSMNAIGGQNDFALKKLPAYQLFKEFSKGAEGNRKWNMASKSRLETVQALNKVEVLQSMKSSTLKGAKEVVADRKRRFVEKNWESIMAMYIKQDPTLDYKTAKNKSIYYLRRLTNSEEFYNFLHSEEYEKLTSKYEMTSGDIIRDYVSRTANLLETYTQLEETQEDVQGQISKYISDVEKTKGKTFEFKQAISSETVLDEELEEIKKEKGWT